ncbi:MAG: TonB-dependent receptor [Taibaiella sp.]|nr:TonB-dependent receptor [Taibaiella sp.]
MVSIRSLFIVFLLGAFNMAAYAQHITISGYVSEQKSGERLTGAIVYIPSLNIGAASNTFGFYSITLPTGTSAVALRASFIGFETFDTSVATNANIELNIQLKEAKELKEVVVKVRKEAAIQERTQMSSINLSIQTIKSLPAFLGEPDIMKAIQLLPGIQGGNEGTSGLYVRGGSPDQNLILLDGVPVYNASHLFGFFSVFNTDAIRSVEVIKGGFPARYGGRLSSVIDINMKEGDKNKIHGEGGLGLIASRLTLEGPIQKGKSSFMVSGRRTYVDVLAKPFMKGDNKGGYYFYDLNGKVNFTLGKKDHLYASGYFGNDKFYFSNVNNDATSPSSFSGGLQWGNITGVGRWNHEFSPKLFGNLTSYYSRYKFVISANSSSTDNGVKDEFQLKYTSGISDVAAKYDLDFFPSPNHFIKAGIGVISHTYTPGVQQTKISSGGLNQDTSVGPEPILGNEMEAYIEDDIHISSRIKVNVGIHAARFDVRNKNYNSLQPRVSARYLINEKLSAKASYVQMTQFINLLTNSSVGLPTDLWVPSTDRIPPQQSQQAAVGLAYTHKAGIEVSLEGYYKTMDNLVEYKEGTSFFNSSTNWEDKVEVGKGSSYGAEVFLQKKKGKFTGMLGYTLSWTNRTFANLNNGQTYPYKYDRRNDFKVAGIYTLSDKVEFSAEWVYGTGNAITLPIGYYQGVNGESIKVYGSRNGFRMPSYNRGDVAVRFTKKKARWERAWIVSVYNVYNRQNPFFIYEDNGEFKQVSLFPVIPAVTYQFKF